jgi:hypothetical protein
MSSNALVYVIPPLSVESSGKTALMFWPVTPPGAVLETSVSLAPGSWVPVANPPVQIGNYLVVPAQMSDPHRFFRVRIPVP